MFMLRPQSKAPIFEQLKSQILEFISLGVLAPNDKLPSVRSLATELGINPNTVSKAYQELELQGYIYTSPGKGCFVGDNHLEDQIRKEQLTIFRSSVMDMKRHNIEKKDLMEVIDEAFQMDVGNKGGETI